jgi:SAM-dependent methyltransferase
MTLPVWMYWEGDCPDWILACRRTIERYAAEPRLLGPREVDQLRDTDRDIDLSGLLVAHRADYLRAFLLARYGGLWVDADCVVTRPLDPVLELLREHEFLGHYERQGRISNAFIGSVPGGRIATAYYERVRDLVRSGRPLSWLSLGALALMDTLRDTGAPWHRLNVELVQPVCWSDPGAFFRVDDPAGHESRVNPRSFCYMLSRNTVDGYLAAHRGADLLGAGTFFTHLIERSGADTEVRAGPVRSTTMRRATRSLLPFCLEAIDDVGPTRVLDLDLGFGRWGMLIREIRDDAAGRVHRENWRTHIEAATPEAHAVEEYHHFFYDWIHTGDPGALLTGKAGRWNLVVLGEAPAAEVVTAALDHADYVLVVTPLSNGWSAGTALARRPVRHALDGDDGAFLLSRDDPRCLRRGPGTADVFARIFDDNLWQAAESRSGPGSGLVQTATIRQEIPKLLARVGARSLLDVPCGDFNWLRHVDLGVDRYLGVDIVPAMIDRNQLEFGDDRRTFLALDARTDQLPRADLILCRDGLVHLSFEDALRAMANFRRTGATHLLATTFPCLDRNDPAATGEWRPLNLQRPPFGLPDPIEVINEGCTEGGGRYADKSLALWRLDGW